MNRSRATSSSKPIAQSGFVTVDSPVRIADEPKSPPRLAPDIGANSKAILKEFGFGAGDRTPGRSGRGGNFEPLLGHLLLQRIQLRGHRGLTRRREEERRAR